jgi:hypothetical protein
MSAGAALSKPYSNLFFSSSMSLYSTWDKAVNGLSRLSLEELQEIHSDP